MLWDRKGTFSKIEPSSNVLLFDLNLFWLQLYAHLRRPQRVYFLYLSLKCTCSQMTETDTPGTGRFSWSLCCHCSGYGIETLLCKRMPSKLMEQAPERRVAGETGGREVVCSRQDSDQHSTAAQVSWINMENALATAHPAFAICFPIETTGILFPLLQVVWVLGTSRGCWVAWTVKNH